ncbi:MAG: ankyrin repeat domain-containing protein, partial [Proteobacteria bacterium]|nr:ankyrin repeat domain-containing protein [Pseudomonadota bacterium]
MNKIIRYLLIGGILMAMSGSFGCKSSGTQANINTATEESNSVQEEESEQLPNEQNVDFVLSKEGVAEIIEQGEVNQPMGAGITPLMIAADIDSVKALIEAGADVNAKAWDENSVLVHALVLTRAMQKDDGRVQLLLNAGAEINEEGVKESMPFHPAINPGYMGYTPLMFAWTLDQVKALVEKGANVNAQTKVLHITPLILALGNKRKNIAKYLIEHGADVNAQTRDGMTPLSVAPDEESVNMLLAKGANVNAPTENGIMFTNVNAGKMRALLKAGFDVHTEYFNSTPLFMAKDIKTAQMLLDAGYDINTEAKPNIRPFGMVFPDEEFAQQSVFPEGVTPLAIAIITQNYELTKFYIDKGAKIKSDYLSLAQSNEIAELLINTGIDINAKDQYGRTALDTVTRLKYAKFLINKGIIIEKDRAYPNLWMIADAELAQMLIEHGVDINKKENDADSIDWFDPETETAIMLTNDPEVAKLLLNAGADIHVTDHIGRSVLMRYDVARENNMMKAMEMGIDRQIMDYAEVDKDIGTPHYNTAKDIIKRGIDNNREIIKLLIEAGADVNASAYDGRTALTNTNDPETIKLLLNAGANPNGGKPHYSDKIKDELKKLEQQKSKTSDADESERLEKLIEDYKRMLEENSQQQDFKRMLEEESIQEAGTANYIFTTLPRELPIVQAANNPESLKLLLAAGADPNVENDDGY